jgi:adenosylcobinamide kinase/adenosylcobinamide-phosphate guanylyltransferase
VSLTFLLGGARSGKSALAVELAHVWEGPVSVIATAEARDEEMAERIRLHRAERPVQWRMIEEPVELEEVLRRVPEDAAAVVDCLSLWVSNLIERGAADADIEACGRSAAALAAKRRALTIAVSNEVGLGVVPATELGRRYRDVLGRVNAEWAAAAADVAFVIAGRRLPLS